MEGGGEGGGGGGKTTRKKTRNGIPAVDKMTKRRATCLLHTARRLSGI